MCTVLKLFQPCEGNREADVAPRENELDTPVLHLYKIEVRSSCLATFLVSPWWRKELAEQVVSRNPGCTAQASSIAQGCRPWDWPTYNRGLKVRVCTQGPKCACQSKGRDGKTLSIVFFCSFIQGKLIGHHIDARHCSRSWGFGYGRQQQNYSSLGSLTFGRERTTLEECRSME